MKASPIQLLSSTLDRVKVEANSEYVDSPKARSDELVLESFKQWEPCPEYWSDEDVSVPGVESRTYRITLGVRTPKSQSGSPYAFDVICSGVVVCLPEGVGDLSPEQAAYQYGCSILFGIIREQVVSLTARMAHGLRLLPTVSFLADAPPSANKRVIRASKRPVRRLNKRA
jgi:hypothetical protein